VHTLLRNYKLPGNKEQLDTKMESSSSRIKVIKESDTLLDLQAFLNKFCQESWQTLFMRQMVNASIVVKKLVQKTGTTIKYNTWISPGSC